MPQEPERPIGENLRALVVMDLDTALSMISLAKWENARICILRARNLLTEEEYFGTSDRP